MAKDGASVTMGDPVRKSPLAALANRTLTADDGTFNLTAAHENVVTSALAALSIIFDNSGGKLILGLGKDGSDIITFKSRTGYENAHAVIEVEGATAVVSAKNFLSNTLVAMDNEISIVIIGFFFDYLKNYNLVKKTDGKNLFISSSPNLGITTLPVTSNFKPVCHLADAMVKTVSV